MIGASSLASGWFCFPVGAACAVGVIHVAPSILARYAAVYGAPHCTREVHCVIPAREWQPGGLFYHGGYPLGGPNGAGFGYGGFGTGSLFGGGSGFAGGGGSGGGSGHKRHRPEAQPAAAAPETPVATPVDIAPDVGAPVVVSAPELPLVFTTPIAFTPSPNVPGAPNVPSAPTTPAAPSTPVPEPASLAVFAFALAALAWVRRHVRRQPVSQRVDAIVRRLELDASNEREIAAMLAKLRGE